MLKKLNLLSLSYTFQPHTFLPTQVSEKLLMNTFKANILDIFSFSPVLRCCMTPISSVLPHKCCNNGFSLVIYCIITNLSKLIKMTLLGKWNLFSTIFFSCTGTWLNILTISNDLIRKMQPIQQYIFSSTGTWLNMLTMSKLYTT